jgi:hypothetical protein
MRNEEFGISARPTVNFGFRIADFPPTGPMHNAGWSVRGKNRDRIQRWPTAAGSGSTTSGRTSTKPGTGPKSIAAWSQELPLLSVNVAVVDPAAVGCR